MDDYLKSLTDFIVNHSDDLPESISWLVELNYDNTIAEFKNYVNLDGNEITIKCDTDDHNSNTELWEWLKDQIRQDVMISKLMAINSITISFRIAAQTNSYFELKDGEVIESLEIANIIEKYLKMAN
jgi:hypothetical protein